MTWSQFLMKAAQLMKIYPECMPLPQKLTEAGFVIEEFEDEPPNFHLNNFIYEWSLSVTVDENEILDLWFCDAVTEECYFLDTVPDKIKLVAEPYLRILGRFEEE